jgi:hypothetical protein
VTFLYKQGSIRKHLTVWPRRRAGSEGQSDLVVSDEDGKPHTVRYEAVNAMLLNEFLKEHRKVEALEETVAQLKLALQEQATQIQKVRAEVRDRSAPRLALGD